MRHWRALIGGRLRHWVSQDRKHAAMSSTNASNVCHTTALSRCTIVDGNKVSCHPLCNLSQPHIKAQKGLIKVLRYKRVQPMGMSSSRGTAWPHTTRPSVVARHPSPQEKCSGPEGHDIVSRCHNRVLEGSTCNETVANCCPRLFMRCLSLSLSPSPSPFSLFFVSLSLSLFFSIFLSLSLSLFFLFLYIYIYTYIYIHTYLSIPSRFPFFLSINKK